MRVDFRGISPHFLIQPGLELIEVFGLW
eukprot:SAG25_NODE_7554_length_473_cov_1.080214_1_plen_27_part_01